jgi:hypothetical protein
MSLGYACPLYLLPFDHRHSYTSGLFDLTPPLTADEHDQVIDSKQVIYEGFWQALGFDLTSPPAGILVDEEFGAGILRDARANGYVTALSTEKSGSDEFELEYGPAFGEHIAAFDPTFASAYYSEVPDPALVGQQVTFGTLGHGGSHLRRIAAEARAIADHALAGAGEEAPDASGEPR